MLRFQHKQVWIWRCSLQISSAAKPDEDYAIASEMLESQSHTRWLQRPRDMTRCSNRLFSALIAIGLPMWIIYTIVSQSGGSRPPSLCKSYGRGSRPSNFGKLWCTHLIFFTDFGCAILGSSSFADISAEWTCGRMHWDSVKLIKQKKCTFKRTFGYFGQLPSMEKKWLCLHCKGFTTNTLKDLCVCESELEGILKWASLQKKVIFDLKLV